MTDVAAVRANESDHAIVPWDPLAQFDAWVQEKPRRFGYPILTSAPSLPSLFDGVDFTPLADVEETEKAWTIDIELPGVMRENVSVETHGRTLAIAGERRERERTGVLRERKRASGSFRYEVALPASFDPDAITAVLADGVLVVMVFKLVESQTHKIPIICPEQDG